MYITNKKCYTVQWGVESLHFVVNKETVTQKTSR